MARVPDREKKSKRAENQHSPLSATLWWVRCDPLPLTSATPGQLPCQDGLGSKITASFLQLLFWVFCQSNNQGSNTSMNLLLRVGSSWPNDLLKFLLLHIIAPMTMQDPFRKPAVSGGVHTLSKPRKPSFHTQ